MECASLIILMSPKHISVIDPAYRDKVRIVPHYIEPNPYESLQRRSTPTYFRYGASRRELGRGLYESILSDGSVDKFVSDERLSAEKDSSVNFWSSVSLVAAKLGFTRGYQISPLSFARRA